MPKKSAVQDSEITKKLSRVKFAERVRNEADDRFGYSRHMKMYGGDFKSIAPTWMSGLDMIPINEVYAYAKTFIPSVYSRDPYIVVNPKGKKYIVGAKILELAVNAYWRELRLKRQIRRAIHDAVFAEGYIKCGYSASLGDSSKPEEGKMLQPSEYVRDEEIFAQRISFRNMVRDPDAIDGLHDARWVAQQIILPLDAVKASSLYENVKDLQPNFSVDIQGAPNYKGDNSYKTEEQYVVIWEEWNRDEQKVYTYAEGSNKYLMNKKWPYKFNGFPFEMLRFNESMDEPYAPNLIGPWEPQLWEKIKIRAMELDHVKRFGRQLVMERGALKPMELDKFKKGISGTILQAESGKVGPQPIPYPPIQTDMYGIENRIDMDKDSISGQPNAVRSAPQKTQSRTLGEIKNIIGTFEGRQADPQTMVEDFAEEIAKDLIGLMQQYFKQAKYIKATALDAGWLQTQQDGNPEADRFDNTGFLMKSEDIKNIDFEVEVRSGSSLPLDKKGRMSSMVSITELGPQIGIQPGGKLSKVVGKNLIAEFDMPEIDAAYEEEIKQMEINQKLAEASQQMQLQMAGKRLNDVSQKVASFGKPANGQPQIPPGLAQ